MPSSDSEVDPLPKLLASRLAHVALFVFQDDACKAGGRWFVPGRVGSAVEWAGSACPVDLL
eukprot:6955740-Alexandrium_andersonii.AAC.1